MKRFKKTSYAIIGMITIMFLITSTIPAVGATLEILPVMRKPLATELCVSYFIMADGGLYSCGENSYGQLGDGTNISKSVPVKILDDALFVDSAYNKTYAITGNGNLYVWGSNDAVEKRITADRKLKPRKIMGNVSSISASIQRCVFVTRNGDLYELDENDKTKKIMSGVRSASAGYSFIAAVKMDGSLWTWGDNTFNGSLGNGTTEPGLVPRQILNDIKSVSCGDEHTLALKNDGTLWAWGSGGNGQLGYGELKDSYGSEEPWGNDRYTPIQVMEDVRYIDTCEDGSLAIKNDGSLWIWGAVYSNVYPETTNYIEQAGVPKKMLDNVSIASASGRHLLLIKNDGTLWACGNNNRGVFGDGQTGVVDKPTIILNDVQDIKITNGYSMALKKDGTVWGWGAISNLDGVMKLDDIADPEQGFVSNKPVQIFSDAKAIAAAPSHRMVIKRDGTLWTWGDNSEGQLGDGTFNSSSVPIKIMEGVKGIDADGQGSCAVDNDGVFYSWGNREENDTKKPVKKDDGVIFFTSCESGYFYLTNDGVLYHDIVSTSESDGWIWRYYAEPVMDANNKILKFPTNVIKLQVYSAGSYQYKYLALSSDGKLYESLNSNKLRLIMSSVKDISRGDTPYIVKNDGSLIKYGENKIILKNICRVESNEQMLALDKGGKLYAWGNNTIGEVGNGTQSIRPFPQKYRSGLMLLEDTKTTPTK